MESLILITQAVKSSSLIRILSNVGAVIISKKLSLTQIVNLTQLVMFIRSVQVAL